MIRIIAFFILVTALGAGLAWLADRPGEVVFLWQGYQVQTSMLALAIAVAVLCVIVVILWQIYRLIVGGPRAIGDFFKNRRQMRGYRALSQGMIAIGAGDVRLAEHHSGEARKLLRNEPLTGLLGAQAAQLAGRHDDASRAFADMLGDEQTILLGLHGLFVQAERVGDQPAADLYADEAVKRAPGLVWAASAVFLAKTRAGDWDTALEVLDRNRRHRVLDKRQTQRMRSVLLTAQAFRDEDNKPEAALNAALEAHKLAPDLVPAALVAGRVAAQLGKFSKATQLLERTWKLSPHPDVAAVYTHLRAGDSTLDRLERARTLSKKLPGHDEGRRALARAAIDTRDFTLARETLAPDLRETPRRGVCLMMAEIENEETGDTGRVRQWLARALRAPRDPAWVADGHVTDVWAPTSPVTGVLDAYQWMVPPGDHAEQATILESAIEPDSAPIAPPAPMIDVSPRAMTPVTEAELTQPSASLPRRSSPEPAVKSEKSVPAVATAATTLAPVPSGPEVTVPETATPSPNARAAAGDGPVTSSSETSTSVPVEAAEQAAAATPAASPVEPAVQSAPASDGTSPSAGSPSALDRPAARAVSTGSGDEASAADSDEAITDVIAFPHPPDDPGPDAKIDDEEDPEKKRRFGLF